MIKSLFSATDEHRLTQIIDLEFGIVDLGFNSGEFFLPPFVRLMAGRGR